MAELGAGACFIEEALFEGRVLRELWSENFDRDDAVHADLARAENRAHSALADFFKNRKTADGRASPHRAFTGARLLASNDAFFDDVVTECSGIRVGFGEGTQRGVGSIARTITQFHGDVGVPGRMTCVRVRAPGWVNHSRGGN